MMFDTPFKWQKSYPSHILYKDTFAGNYISVFSVVVKTENKIKINNFRLTPKFHRGKIKIQIEMKSLFINIKIN